MKKKRIKKHKKLPNLNYLLTNYRYDPITGILYKKSNDKPVGWNQGGYLVCRILKQQYKVHRIVFYMFHRRDPGKQVIDHIDGDKQNNKIVNLRCVTQRENLKNTATRREQKGLPKLEPNAWRVLAIPVF